MKPLQERHVIMCDLQALETDFWPGDQVGILDPSLQAIEHGIQGYVVEISVRMGCPAMYKVEWMNGGNLTYAYFEAFRLRMIATEL